jgi:hypothetical protein
MLEIHINDVPMTAMTTSSGMRLITTTNLRQYDAGFLTFGTNVDDALIIPPNAVNSRRVGFCPSACTQVLPETGINIFTSLLHAHLAGVALRTRHIAANGTEYAPLSENDNYDFNYQVW